MITQLGKPYWEYVFDAERWVCQHVKRGVLPGSCLNKSIKRIDHPIHCSLGTVTAQSSSK